MSVYHTCVWCIRQPDEISDPLELEFKMLVSHHLGAGIQTQVPDGEVLFWNIWAGQKKKNLFPSI